MNGYNAHVKGARTLLGWAIENLLKNSIDACSHKKSEIKILLSKDSNHVNLDVMDDGEGISKSNWKNIFNAGYSKKKKGWGLGLSLTKRIIEKTIVIACGTLSKKDFSLIFFFVIFKDQGYL